MCHPEWSGAQGFGTILARVGGPRKGEGDVVWGRFHCPASKAQNACPSPICPHLLYCHSPLEGLSQLWRQPALFQTERHLIVPPCVGRLGMPLCKSLLGIFHFLPPLPTMSFSVCLGVGLARGP